MGYEVAGSGPLVLRRTGIDPRRMQRVLLGIGLTGTVAAVGYVPALVAWDPDLLALGMVSMIVWGVAAAVGAVALGTSHGGEPAVITQPRRVELQREVGAPAVLRIGRRRIDVADARRVEFSRIPGGEMPDKSLVRVVLQRNLVDLTFHDREAGAAVAERLSAELGLGGEVVYEDVDFLAASVLGPAMLFVLVIVAQCVGVLFAGMYDEGTWRSSLLAAGVSLPCIVVGYLLGRWSGKTSRRKHLQDSQGTGG